MSWEESEEIQRSQALIISLVFAVAWGGSLILAVWNREWDSAFWLISAIGAVALGIATWAGAMKLLIYCVTCAVRLLRHIRGANDGGNRGA